MKLCLQNFAFFKQTPLLPILQTLLDNILYQNVRCKASTVKIQPWVKSDPASAHLRWLRRVLYCNDIKAQCQRQASDKTNEIDGWKDCMMQRREREREREREFAQWLFE